MTGYTTPAASDNKLPRSKNDFGNGNTKKHSVDSNTETPLPRHRKPFVQVPAKAGSVPLAVQGFLRLIMEDSGFDGYTTTPINVLARRAGISRKTAFAYMAIIKAHKLAERRWVDGEYRTYHADQNGVLTLPGGPDVRHPRVAHAPPQGGALDVPRLIGTRAGLNSRDLENVNVASLPEKLPPSQACIQLPAEVPAPAPEFDGIDAELVAMSDEELEALVARLGRSGRTDDVSKVFIARCLLRERRAASVAPELTPQVKAIVPPAVPTAPSRPTIFTLADQCRRTAGPAALDALARRLATDLNDFGSLAFYRKQGQRVRSGELDPRMVVKAYAQARSPGVDCPGSVFNSRVRGLQ